MVILRTDAYERSDEKIAIIYIKNLSSEDLIIEKGNWKDSL